MTYTDLKGGWGGTEQEADALNDLLTGGPEAVRLAEGEVDLARTALPAGVGEVV